MLLAQYVVYICGFIESIATFIKVHTYITCDFWEPRQCIVETATN